MATKDSIVYLGRGKFLGLRGAPVDDPDKAEGFTNLEAHALACKYAGAIVGKRKHFKKSTRFLELERRSPKK